MRMKDIIRKSFHPEWFIKVGQMEDGEPPLVLLREVYKGISSSYNSLLDSENGVIYLKEKEKKEKTNV